MTALLALVLAAAPGCPGALAGAAALAADEAAPARLAARAREIVDALEAAGAGGPVDAIRREAGALAAPAAEGDAAPGDLARFRRTLARHCALAGGPPAPGASASDRAALAAILARPEYARAAGDPEALRRTILRLWAELLELLGTSEAGRYASAGRALFLTAAAAAIALAALALRRRGREGRPGAPPEPFAVRTGTRGEATAGDAAEALARGDAREAVRRSFLAALAALERAGRVRGGRMMTNEEVVAAVGGAPAPRAAGAATSTSTPAVTPAPALASDVAALARVFDRVVYGGLPVGLEEARAAVDRARAVASRAEPAS